MKKGFTLTEVLVVIIILSIIILMAVPAYLGITETLKQREYDNKIKQIEVKATEWATDNNITEDTTIPLSKLIDEGYIQMDDETSLDKRVVNPLNNESMECYHVNIRVENNTYNIKVEESNDCELKELEEQDNNIKVVGYEIDSATNKIINTTPLKVNGGELPWTGKDILLVTTSEIYKEPKSITYSSGGNEKKKTGSMYEKEPELNEIIEEDKYQNVLIVTTSVILRSKYTITYEMENETPKKNILVKIDKENPTGEANMLEKWGNKEEKKVLLSGSDGVGSGVKRFYISKDQNIDNATSYEAEDNQKEVNLELGNYYYWIEDKVGNRNSEGKEVIVNNIDEKAPECIYPDGNSNWTKEEVKIEWGCKDNESGCKEKNKSVTFNEEGASQNNYTVFDGNDYENGVRGEYIYDAAGNRTFCAARDIPIKYDREKPNCEAAKVETTLNTAGGVTVNVTCSDKETGSGIAKCASEANKTSYSQTGVKTSQANVTETKKYSVEDKLGNKNECSVDVTSYTTYRQQTRSKTWNSCQSTYSTCQGGYTKTCYTCNYWYKCNGPYARETGSISNYANDWSACDRAASLAGAVMCEVKSKGAFTSGASISSSRCGWSNCATGCATCGCNGGYDYGGWGSWSGYSTSNYCSSDTCQSQSQIWYK